MISAKLACPLQNRILGRMAYFARILTTLCLVVFSVKSVALQPTPQQIEQFKRMSPTEQSRLAEQLGISMPNQQTGSAEQYSQPVQTLRARQMNPAFEPYSSAYPNPYSNPYQYGNRQVNPYGKQGYHPDTTSPDGSPYLPHFGYDLFAGSPTTFEPVTDIPVSSDYLLGIGDSLKVNFYGKISQFFDLTIDQEGQAYIPELGPISLLGLTFHEAKEKIKQMVDQRMIGVKVGVSMGQLRSIRVFVLGEAYVPGSYIVSSLSTITNALVLSGGISELGSLRNIQLKRQGELITTLDLYDLLLKGDTQSDVQLQSGDVVFIPPVSSKIGIHGEVLRPAYYELKEHESIDDLVAFSGGFLASAYPNRASLERILSSGERTLINLDLTAQPSNKVSLQDGDVLELPSVLKKVEQVVKLSGYVERTGTYSWKEGMRVSQLVPSVDMLKSQPDLDYAIIKRYAMPSRRLSILSFSLNKALAAPGSSDDVLLQDQDELLFFSKLEREVEQEMDENGMMRPANQQAYQLMLSLQDPLAVEQMDVPLVRPFKQKPDTNNYFGNVSSTDNTQNSNSSTKPWRQSFGRINTAALNQTTLEGDDAFIVDQAYDLMMEQSLLKQLKPGRVEQVTEIIQELRSQAGLSKPSREVTVSGDVRYPGIYPLTEGMGVGDLIVAAGGLTERAFRLYAELNRSEFDELQVLSQTRKRLDLSQTESLEQTLSSRDVLQIKTIPNWAESNTVNITGEVRFPGTYAINKDDTLATVIERAGGLTEYSYAPGAMFTRIALKQQQEKQLNEMQQRLEADIAKAGIVMSGQAGAGKAGQSAELGEAQKLLSQLKSTEATGRLVIDLEKVLKSDTDYIIALEDGDELIIPRKKNSVTIVGEVQLSISQVYENQLDHWDYIERSGGLTSKADEERIYIIKANGSVLLPKQSNWFATSSQQLNPGDTIVVPLDAEKVDEIMLWRDVTQIFYQIALGAAAVGSL